LMLKFMVQYAYHKTLEIYDWTCNSFVSSVDELRQLRNIVT